MSIASSGGIFISYRRQETSHLAGRVYDRLADRFGDDQVFMDVDTIELGDEFAQVITQAVGSCRVLLAVIGPQWLTASDEQDQRRLDDPHDLVRLEVEAALQRDVRVIPILAEGAVMPRQQELPESLVGLAGRNAIDVRHASFHSDMQRLVMAIEGIVQASTPAPPDIVEVECEIRRVGDEKRHGIIRSLLTSTKGTVLEARITRPDGRRYAKFQSNSFDISGNKPDWMPVRDKIVGQLQGDGWKKLPDSSNWAIPPYQHRFRREFEAGDEVVDQLLAEGWKQLPD